MQASRMLSSKKLKMSEFKVELKISVVTNRKVTMKENDLVLVRLHNNLMGQSIQSHYNVWIRVLFIDLDHSFTGRVERLDRDYEGHKIDDIITLSGSKVLNVFDEKDGKQWCYSDNVTRCDCKGLCRNK